MIALAKETTNATSHSWFSILRTILIYMTINRSKPAGFNNLFIYDKFLCLPLLVSRYNKNILPACQI